MTPSRQERHCSASSSSSSSSPTATSSENETREREDRTESDISPVPVSTNVDKRSGRPNVDRANKTPKTNEKGPQKERRDTLLKEQGDPLYSEIPEWLQEFREDVVDDRVPEHGDSHASFLMNYLLSPRLREVRIWVKTVFILIHLRTEIARSVRGRKLQGPRAEDAMAEPYLVLKMLVT